MNHKIGVTKLVSNFNPIFDKKVVSERVAESQACTPEQVISDWEDKKDLAIKRGNSIHQHAEQYLHHIRNPENFDRPVLPRLGIQRLELSKLESFCDSMISQGWIVGCIEQQVETQFLIGKIDCIWVNHNLKKCLVIDWKTALSWKEFNKMIPPLDNLWSNKKTDAALQLSIYRRMALKSEMIPPNYETTCATVLISHRKAICEATPLHEKAVNAILRSLTDTQ